MTHAGAGRPFVTVVVPVFNERGHIRECLASLLDQDYPPGLVEILVVDGMSTDGSREIVREVAEAPAALVLLLDNPRRIPAAALNLGIRSARGDVILRLDAHARAEPDFIRQSVEALERSGADCVGGTIQTLARTPSGRAIALAMGSPFGVGGARFRYARREQYVDTVAFGAYPRRVFERIGLYDEDLLYCEDNELNDRVRRSGGKILLAPAIRSVYFARGSLGGLWQQYFHYGFGRARLALRAPDTIRPRHLAPFVFVTVLSVTALLGMFQLCSGWILPPLFAQLFVLIAGIYLAVALGFSLAISLRSGFRSFVKLPAAFACMHLGYGLGTWAGLLSLLAKRPPSREPPAP